MKAEQGVIEGGPETLRTERPVLVELRPQHAEKNAALAGMLRRAAEKVEGSSAPVAGVGVVIAWSDGTVGTAFDGDSWLHLLGALAVLRRRVEDRYDPA
jgi:hypothetical protein